jgi:perosamine synthetase
MVGFKYKISNIQAAIGCAQLERVDDLIAAKRQIFTHYQKQLSGLPLTLNPEPTGTVNGYWMPSIVVEDGVLFDREELLTAFRADSIDGRVFFWPLSMLPMFEGKPENLVSYRLFDRAVNLPSYHDLTETDIKRVVRHIREYLKAECCE